MKVVRSSASRTGRLYPQEMFLALIFTRGWVDPRGHGKVGRSMSLKNPVTPPGIDAGTVRLISHCLKYYDTPDPNFICVSFSILTFLCFYSLLFSSMLNSNFYWFLFDILKFVHLSFQNIVLIALFVYVAVLKQIKMRRLRQRLATTFEN